MSRSGVECGFGTSATRVLEALLYFAEACWVLNKEHTSERRFGFGWTR